MIRLRPFKTQRKPNSFIQTIHYMCLHDVIFSHCSIVLCGLLFPSSFFPPTSSSTYCIGLLHHLSLMCTCMCSFPPLSNNKSSHLAWLMLLKKVFPTPCNAGDTSNNGGVQNAFVKPSPRPRSKLSRTNTGSSDHSDDSLDSPKPKRVRHETEINCVDCTLSSLKNCPFIRIFL